MDWNMVTPLEELEVAVETTLDVEDVSVEDGYEVEAGVALVVAMEDDVDAACLGENEA